jgi:membrane protease YdiL (CAAX protease family)
MNGSTTYPMWRPLAGVAIAIAITTTMDATGLTMFSSLPLLPLAGLFWYLGRYPRREVGVTTGSPAGYWWAIAYPVVVPGILAGMAFATGAVDLTEAEWGKTATNIGLMSVTGVLAVFLTEEGFFRGWLWASLKKTGQDDRIVLVWTSVLFSLWHLSAVTLDTGFNPPLAQIPVFMVNACLLGLNWGLMRQLSGSVFAASLSHAVWNGVVYEMFGFGEKAGELGIEKTAWYGPEIGILGLVLNALFALVLWRRVMRSGG